MNKRLDNVRSILEQLDAIVDGRGDDTILPGVPAHEMLYGKHFEVMSDFIMQHFSFDPAFPLDQVYWTEAELVEATGYLFNAPICRIVIDILEEMTDDGASAPDLFAEYVEDILVRRDIDPMLVERISRDVFQLVSTLADPKMDLNGKNYL
jgi:hypothetical protein